jgi:hypothetical protein
MANGDTPQSTTCAFGRENRVMIMNIHESVSEIKNSIEKMTSQITILFNHQSKKPSWFVTCIITALTTLSVSLVVYIFTSERHAELMKPGNTPAVTAPAPRTP